MTKFMAFLRNLFRNNTFLKIFSVVVAIVLWLIIVNVASPTKTKTFTNIPVEFDYSTSTPARNGLLMLLSDDTQLSVDLTVEGQRATLMTYSQSKISVTLDLDSIAAPGTYSVAYKVTLGNDNLSVTEISPGSTLVVEFAKKASKTVDLETSYTGTPYSGYEVYSEQLSKTEVIISGPESVINSVSNAVVAFNLDGRHENIDENVHIELRDSASAPVDTRYVTFENGDTAEVTIEFARKIPLKVEATNIYGGDESPYTEFVYSPDSVYVQGSFDTVATIDAIILDTIELSSLTDSHSVKSYVLPEIDGIVYLPDKTTGILPESVSVEIFMTGTYTKTLNYTAADVAAFDQINIPTSAEPVISGGVSVKIRTLSENAAAVTRDSVKLTIDYSQKNSDGQYKLIIKLPDGINGGVLGEYFVTVTWK